MKTRRLSLIISFSIIIARSASAACTGPLSYTIPIVPGLNLIANQLHCGGDTLNDIMPSVPDGTTIMVFNNATKNFDVATYVTGVGWEPSLTLEPGAGAFVQSPVAFSLRLAGSPSLPVLPVPLPSDACCILSRQTNAVGRYENIVGTPPAEGTALYKWKAATQSYEIYTFDLGVWSPAVPTAAVGEAVAICTPSTSVALCGTQSKWSQLPGYRVFTNSPNARGGDRPSDVDWNTLMNAGSNVVDPNWVMADDFRSDGRPILTVRWWGSYLSNALAGAEDGYVISFFNDVPATANPSGLFSQPGSLLGTYVAPVEVVRRRDTRQTGGDGLPIYQYEVNLKDTCLDHAVTNIATPRAFLERSNTIYWLAITAEVGHQIKPATNNTGQIIDWEQTPTNKRATNHFWGWHTSPTNRLDRSVMGHLLMPTATNWLYPSNLWRTNAPFQMELDQAFELLTCDTNPPTIVGLNFNCESNTLFVRFSEPVDPITATVPSNYSTQALSVILVDATTASVLFPPCRTNYAGSVRNIADLCGNVLRVGTNFVQACRPCPGPKIAKWTQLPGYLTFTHSGENPDRHGGDRFSDIDWVTLMNADTNLVQPNWVIADDFRSDGRPILCVRWWGSYVPGFEPTTTGTHFEDGYVLSFFSDARSSNNASRPNQLLGSYVAPIAAVQVTPTSFLGWDSNRIYQYEVALEDTCLDHPSPNIARPDAFREVTNTVYWLAITAEVGHRIVPIRNTAGLIVDWQQQTTNKRATNHFWGWHTAPTNREDVSVMGHVYMRGTNWLYPTNQWMRNAPFHMELDQAFQLLTSCDTNAPRITNFNFSCDTGILTLSFNEPVDPTSATDLSNYGGPGIVSSAVLLDAATVSVSLILPPCNSFFGLCITGIKDLCGNVLSPGICIDFYCPCPSVEKIAKWEQPPGYLVFTNAGQNPQMHGGDRPSDVDWLTLMQSGTNLVQPNWVIADDFRSDGRPILCVRWWGSYLPGVQPGFEDGYVLSFFSDFRPSGSSASRPNRLLGSYVAPLAAVKVKDTGFIGWDSNKIYQYEVALEDTCLDHAVSGLATPGAFLEQSNTVYWLAITAEVGHRIVPITNDCGVVLDWVQTASGKRATNHFWGWHTSPTNREDRSVMGHVFMQGTNWLYPTNQWMPNEVFHMELDQAFVLLCTNPPANPPANTQPVKWSQPPGFVLFTNAPQMHGGDRPSDVDWITLMQNPTAFVQPNSVVADDFRSDGRPILAVRWWGSYLTNATPGFEDGYVLSFFSDFQPAAGGFSRPTNLLASYIAPRSAVRVSRTPYVGWDSNCIYQYEVDLRNTCLDHAVTNLATPEAFLERSNTVYWLAITAEVGHRVVPITNSAGAIVDWQQQTTGKRATNHYWGWHTSPSNRLDTSVTGRVLMPGTNWVYPFGQWMTNAAFHMERDQAFELITTCDTNAPTIVGLDFSCESNKLVVRFSEPVDPATATLAANYGMQALSVTLVDASTACVLLPPCETNYLVRTHDIADLCGNIMPVGIDFHQVCPPCPPKVAKWTQLPGYLVFTNTGANTNMYGGDRPSDVDWGTLMTAGTNLVQPNWVIADDFRSDGRPILCVRWWGSYLPGFEPTATGNHFEDGYVLSFFSDFRPTGSNASRPNQLLGTYVAPINAVKVTRTPFFGWDSNRIYQYEVALEETCLDHSSPNIAQPDAFREVANTVYWLAITAEVGHRVVPVRNATGQIIDWQQTPTEKSATNHFWGWHTAPTNREDVSVMGHVYMQGTNWLYPTNQWMANQPLHMELDQAFQLLTSCDTNAPRITNFNFSCDTGILTLSFNEPVDPTSATDLSNYGGPGIVSSAVLLDAATVSVSLILPPCNSFFGLCITGIKDLCGNVLSPGICIDFYCPCPSVEKIAKWAQLPGYLVFTNTGANTNMYGGDRPSDVDWLTLMQSGTNLVQPNWVIADDFRSDGRPILCVRWWGSYLGSVQPGFEDGYVLSFFSDFQASGSGASRPNQLLGSYLAPLAAVKVRDTGFIGWDSNKIYQYEVALEDTCLDHAVSGLATPGAFLERSNTVYWLAITAEVGHRVVPITNDCGVVLDWVQTASGKRATNHFWGWHTAPTNRLDLSVMGHVYMQSTNWLYPTNQWMTNAPFHMELDQAFVLLCTNPPANPKPVKWSQPPGFVLFTNAPQMHGGDRPSDVDWITLMQNPTAFVQPNWVIADDFRSDGRPILAVRWWGSYLQNVAPGFEDGYVLSFFSDFQPAAGGFSRPTNLLASYIAPRAAVRVSRTPYVGWDSNCIYQYEVNLRDTCLDHAVTNLATRQAFREQSNTVYWLAITAEVGHRVVPITNSAGAIVDWQQQTTGKRATNHYWGWHTSPTNRLDISVMGHVLMPSNNWVYPFGQWQTNAAFHMERDQAFELLTRPLPPTLHIVHVATGVEISWEGEGFHLQAAPSLNPPGPPFLWVDLPGESPIVVPTTGPYRFFRAIDPAEDTAF